MASARAESRWVAANVRRLRIKKNWPQERLAEEAGFSARVLSVIESGKTDMRLSSLSKLADALGVLPHVLLIEPKNLDVPVMKPGEAKARAQRSKDQKGDQ